jgi:selenocysteine-specific elongation factor
VSEALHAVIGTAGHIDHGKTALVKALTGCDTDRLKEEKERGISIDLGFAALDLGGRRVGIVDVPGHERFIRNMLAGAHALDLVLFTVAADDGVMPQTEEHLDIVHLLGVERGVIALTKADLASPARLRAVEEEIEILVAGTRLEGAPVVPVSATTGAGLDALRAELARQLARLERPAPIGPFRLPVDRAFVMKGHGVVVTGTAVAGTIAAGAEVRVLPAGARLRVRSVEVHGAPVAAAGWRQRVALNLAGAERAAIARGDVIADPSVTLVTDRLDARVEIRPAASKGVRDHARVRLHLGTAEVLGKIVLLEGGTVLPPRAAAFAQLALERPVVAWRGDRFILRAENARTTLGGGEVVLPVAERHRRRDAALAARLDRLWRGTLAEAAVAVLELARELSLAPAALAERLNAAEAALRAALAGAPGVLALDDGTGEVWTTAGKWEALRAAVRAIVAAFHAATPLAPGLEMEAVRTRLPWEVAPKLFRAVVERLAGEGVLARRESLVAAPGHRVTLGSGEEALAARVEDALARAGLTPPDVKVLAADLGVPRPRLAEVLGVLEAQGRVARVSPDLYYAAGAVARARAALEEHLASHAEITAAELRDRLDVSRKFSIALLDYFDRGGVTLRVGDARRLRRG